MQPVVYTTAGRPRIPVTRWKLLAAIAIHAILPAFLVALAVDAAMGRLGQDVALAVPKALSFAGWFLLAYAALAAAACGLAALCDLWAPPEACRVDSDPAMRFTGILARGQGRFRSEGDAALLSLARLGPHVTNPQALADDLDALVDTAVAAMAAEPARGSLIAEDTAKALTRMSTWVAGQTQVDAEHASDAARIQTIFVNAKYGSDNF